MLKKKEKKKEKNLTSDKPKKAPLREGPKYDHDDQLMMKSQEFWHAWHMLSLT